MARRLLLVLALASSCWQRTPDLRAPLPADPEVTVGRLPSGLRYWIRPNRNPPGKTALRLRVGVGLQDEAPPEAGFSHLTEHVAFAGSRDLDRQQMQAYLDQLGLIPGADLNATTSAVSTSYFLTVPSGRAEDLGRGLHLLAEVAARASFQPAEIRRECDIVQAEDRERAEAKRLIERGLGLDFPDLPAVARGARPARPAGFCRDLERGDLWRYYRKWYRPDNTLLIAVGDLQPADLIRQIEARFGDWRAEGAPPPRAPLPVRFDRPFRAEVVTTPSADHATAELRFHQPPHPARTLGDLRAQLLDSVTTALLHRRLDDRIKQEPVFTAAAAAPYQVPGVASSVAASLSGPGDQGERLVEALVSEVRRGLEQGFSTAELRVVKTGYRQLARNQPAQAASPAIARSLGTVADTSDLPVDDRRRRELLAALVRGVSATEVRAAFSRRFSLDRAALLLTVPDRPGLQPPTAPQLADLVQRRPAPAAAGRPSDQAAARLPELSGSPASVTSLENEPPIGAFSAALSNGVRLFGRPIDQRPDQVAVAVSIDWRPAAGAAAGNPETARAAALALERPSAGSLDAAAIARLLGDRGLSLTGQAGPDRVVFRLAGRADRIEEGLRLVHLILSQPRVGDDWLSRWRARAAAGAPAAEESLDRAWQGDPAAPPGQTAGGASLTAAEVQTWLDRQLAAAPLEVALVGDLPQDRMVALVARTLGRLPLRAAPRAGPAARRSERHGPIEKIIQRTGSREGATVRLAWRSDDTTLTGSLQLLERIATRRLKDQLRERRGLVYSLNASFTAGWLQVSFTADPRRAAEAAGIARATMATLAREGPTGPELETARAELRNGLPALASRPDFWIRALEGLALRGHDLPWLRQVLTDRFDYSASEVRDQARALVEERRRLQVIVLPES